MEQENQEQDIEMKQEFQSYRDEIKNKVCAHSCVHIVLCLQGRLGRVICETWSYF